MAVPAVVAAQVASDDSGDDGGSEAVEEELGVAHVHGLGVNPADNDLYVATHHGVFRIGRDGKADHIGPYQDTMGFTVVGADRFLGSGHPDLAQVRAGKRPLLGLIETTDAAKTWRSLSLDGEADFHGLAAAHDLIYGYDSTGGRFMVSADGGDAWTTRSTLQLADFAVDPTDADHVLAAGPEGLLDSVDGGRTWSAVVGPLLAVVSWDPEAGLFGAQPDGTLHHSPDGGKAWEQAGRLDGQPEALLARPDVLYAAAAADDGRSGIYRSKDGGQSWSLIYRDPA